MDRLGERRLLNFGNELFKKRKKTGMIYLSSGSNGL